MAEDAKSSSELAANLTIAWLNNPNVRANTKDVNKFLRSVHATLQGLNGEAAPSSDLEASSKVASDTTKSSDSTAGGSSGNGGIVEPAVTVRKSLASREHILSMIDGKKYRTLKRHIGTHGMTPKQYRERFGLKPDYPMVAPAYAEQRSALAKQIGLGVKGKAAKAARTAAAPQKPAAAKAGAARPAKAKSATAKPAKALASAKPSARKSGTLKIATKG